MEVMVDDCHAHKARVAVDRCQLLAKPPQLGLTDEAVVLLIVLINAGIDRRHEQTVLFVDDGSDELLGSRGWLSDDNRPSERRIPLGQQLVAVESRQKTKVIVESRRRRILGE